MDLTVLNLAVPHPSADLHASGSQLLWIVDVYRFMVAGWLITMGTLGDRIGRRRLLLTGAIVAGLGVGVVFVRRQQRLADPPLDLRLFANRTFSESLAANTASFFVGFGAFLFIAQYLQLVLGLSRLQAGLWLLRSSTGFIVGSMLARCWSGGSVRW